MADLPLQDGEGKHMTAWGLVILLCLVDGLLCHELMKVWDKEKSEKEGGNADERDHTDET